MNTMECFRWRRCLIMDFMASASRAHFNDSASDQGSIFRLTTGVFGQVGVKPVSNGHE